MGSRLIRQHKKTLEIWGLHYDEILIKEEGCFWVKILKLFLDWVKCNVKFVYQISITEGPNPRRSLIDFAGSRTFRLRTKFYPAVRTSSFRNRATVGTCAGAYILTLRLLMSYIYGAPSKARDANVVYIWTYVWQLWNSLFLFAAQCFNTESMQRGFLCHICV